MKLGKMFGFRRLDLNRVRDSSFRIVHQLRRYLEVASAALKPFVLPALIVGTLAVGFASGLLATKLPLKVTLLALGGILVVLSAFSKPELVILLMLVASSSIYDLGQIPTINVGFGFTAVELCLIYLLGLVVAQALGNKDAPYVKTPLDWPVALFFLASLISFVNSILNLRTDMDLMEYQWRILFSYLVFFAVTNLVRTRQQLLTLVSGVLVIAAIVATLMIVQQAVGPSVPILPGRVETAGVFEQNFAGVTRILPPGQSLVLVALMPAFIILLSRERMDYVGWLLTMAVFVLLIALAFTFNRNMWIGTTASVATVFLISTRNQRRNMLLFLCAFVIIGAITVPLLVSYFPKLNDVLDALYIRAASLFTGEQVENSSSWQWRVMENEYALIKIKQYPLLGIGPGNDYRPRIRLGGDRNTGYMHNTFLFILMDLGIVGFAPFVWFSALFLLRGYLLWAKIRDKVFRGVVLGFTLSYVTVLIAGVAAPVFMAWYWTPVLGVMLGINEVIYTLNTEAAR